MAEKDYPKDHHPEHLDEQPGKQNEMQEQPISDSPDHKGSDKLLNKIVLLTGGDSGIGRAVAIACAREGADIALNYLNEEEDARTTKELVEKEGSACLLIPGDIGDEQFCNSLVKEVIGEWGSIDVLINNAGEQHVQSELQDITAEQLEKTFKTNIFSMFYVTKAVLPHLKEGSTIINTTSVTAFKGHPVLLDYSATKGAIVAFTQSLALSLADKNIRVNAVAPGPIWTPLIPATFPPDKVKEFGQDTPLGRAGQPEELAMAYVYLACSDSSYMTGQTLHINGGTIVT